MARRRGSRSSPDALSVDPGDARFGTMAGLGTHPAVRRAMLALRRDAIEAEPGDLLGREDALIERYGVSRPTLRQAAGLVALEQLLQVRRGVGGGYFADRPDSSAVAHLAAIVLQVREVQLAQMLHAIEPIRIDLIQLAAINATEAHIAELQQFLDDDGPLAAEEVGFRHFLRRELKHNDIIGRASGNRVLHPFMKILLELVATLRKREDVLFGRRARIASWRQQRNKIIQAVIERDAERAVLEARRAGRLMQVWIGEDEAEHSGAPASADG